MFGRDYLRDICLDGGNDADLSLNIHQSAIRSNRFAIDHHGLRGIRIIYPDRTESPWLGTGKDCWYGEAHGCDLALLSVIKDVGTPLRDEDVCLRWAGSHFVLTAVTLKGFRT